MGPSQSSHPHSRFGRLTLLTATAVIHQLIGTHASFQTVILELGLEGTGAGEGSGLEKRASSLATFAVEYPEFKTLDGEYLGDAIVGKAVELAKDTLHGSWDGEVSGPPVVEKFRRALQRD